MRVPVGTVHFNISLHKYKSSGKGSECYWVVPFCWKKIGLLSRGEIYFSEGQLKGVLEMQVLT